MFKKTNRNAERVRRHERVRRKISGTPECPRLNVFRSNAHIHAQLIDDVNGVTLAASSTVQLKIKDGGNVEAAKTIGDDIAKKALAINIENVVFDRGGYIYTGRVQALADSARNAGLKF